jgi:ABC-type glycerol-3-phosphate transport system permease component
MHSRDDCPYHVGGICSLRLCLDEFSFRNMLFVLVIGLLVIPLQMTFIPVLRMYQQLEFTGTFPRHLVSTCRLRAAIFHLPAKQLHRSAAA